MYKNENTHVAPPSPYYKVYVPCIEFYTKMSHTILYYILQHYKTYIES